MRKLTIGMYLWIVLLIPAMSVSKAGVTQPPDCKDDCNNQGNACVGAANLDYETATQGIELERDCCLVDAESDYQSCINAAEAAWDYCLSTTCGYAQTGCMAQCDNTYYYALQDCLNWNEEQVWYCSDNYANHIYTANYIRELGIDICENERAICIAGCPPAI